ncbi:MAG: type II toxin-antitoxin system VapC family toxin [Candidatus Sulfotelmatobacter sp.]
MIGLDTNVLVRYLTHDEPKQAAAATRVMNSLSFESPGFLSLIVIAELVWVLGISYRYQKKEIEQVLENLLRSKELVIERADIVSQASRAFRAGHADFADYLIERCAHAADCQFTLTFDQEAATVTGMRLLR